jgi:hypothetical protein
MNKKVTVNGQVHEMYQVKMTNWVFVRWAKRGQSGTCPVAKVVAGEIVALDEMQAISAATNQELAEAWVNS